MYNSKSQNLVPNPGFENITFCDAGSGAIYEATPWFQPFTLQGNTTNSSSSDLFDTCANFTTEGIPLNFDGYQPARTGHGYAGIYLELDTLNYREYIEVPLLSVLIANNEYCVEFYVSLADSSEKATSNIGAYFSVDSLLDGTIYHTINYVTPQVENPVTNILSDTVHWMFVSGNFIATGGEKFMTIGNFQTPVNTNIQNSTGTEPGAYYYIDDVSVTQCSVGVAELGVMSEELEVYPNPVNDKLTIQLTEPPVKAMLTIYNVLGCEMLPFDKLRMTNDKSVTIDVSSYASGVYFIQVQTEKGIMRKKFVKQ